MTITAKCLAEGQFAGVSSTTIYTTPGSTRTIIDKLTATNTDASARTITVHIVPSGSSEADSNLIVSVVSISANSVYDIVEMKNQILNSGDFLTVTASVGAKVAVRASGREIT